MRVMVLARAGYQPVRFVGQHLPIPVLNTNDDDPIGVPPEAVEELKVRLALEATVEAFNTRLAKAIQDDTDAMFLGEPWPLLSS